MQGAGQTDCEHKYRYLKVLPFVLRAKSFLSFTSRQKGTLDPQRLQKSYG